MTTPVLFVLTVLLWGTTWIASAAQVGEVPVMVSIFCRFALAGLLMLAGLAALGRLRRPAVRRFVVVQALCHFCLNFVGLYTATSLVSSGLASVVFSPASVFNAVNAGVFFSDPISRQTVLAGGLGVAGLGVTPMIANAWGAGDWSVLPLGPSLAHRTASHPAPWRTYWTALVYLVVAGSILGFATYLMRVGRIGSAKVGYATVLFPIVALSASTRLRT